MSGRRKTQKIKVGARDVCETGIGQIIPEHNLLWQASSTNGHRHWRLRIPIEMLSDVTQKTYTPQLHLQALMLSL